MQSLAFSKVKQAGWVGGGGGRGGEDGHWNFPFLFFFIFVQFKINSTQSS